MLPELLLVMTGMVLILVLGAAAVIAIRMNRLSASLPADLDDRLIELDSGVKRIEGEIGRSEAAIREEAVRVRDEEREALMSLRQDVTSSVRMLAEGLRTAVTDLAMMQRERLASFESVLSHVRSDAASDAKNLREEVRSTLVQFGDAISRSINQLSEIQRERLDAATAEIARLATGNEQRQEALRRAIEAKLGEVRTDATASSRSLAEEITGRLRILADGLTQSVQQTSEAQRERLDGHARLVTALSQGIESRQMALRQAVEARLDAVQAENSQKLEQVRAAIDGELQSARDLRLFDSVKRVSDSLDQVHKAVGEMQSIAGGSASFRAIPRSFDSPR